MTFTEDHRVTEAHAKPIGDVVHMLGIQRLQRQGHELIGPCPHCGGRDRFGVNLRKNMFLCRRCEAKGDQIALVMFDRGLDFLAALDWLCGPADGISEAERADRRRKAEAARVASDAVAARKRQESIVAAKEVWRAASDTALTPVIDYLARRGLRLAAMPACLRCHPALPYRVFEQGGWREIHRGPAMIAAVQRPDGMLEAVHRTWIDPAQTKGKARIVHPQSGEVMPAKKTLGSVKGNAIRLTGRHCDATLVMGEGIETTLSALVAGAIPGAMFWAGVSLGNMGGRKVSGPGKKFAGLPDMEDADAFLPPAGIKRLVYVQDGDSDPRHTRSTLEAGLRRAMVARPGLKGQIVAAPQGMDLNDVLLTGGKEGDA